MGLTFFKGLPPVVGTKNDTWLIIELSLGVRLVVQVLYHTTVLTTLRMSVDALKSVSFNIKRILQAVGDPNHTIDVDLPEFNASTVSYCQQSVKYFSVRLMELTLDESVITDITLPSIALLAGLNPELAYSQSLLSYLQGPPRKFSTNKPLKKLTGTITQEYLYYFNSNTESPDSAIDLCLKIYFDDGSSSAEIIYSSQVIIAAILPAGFTQLNIESHVPAGRKVIYYEVYIKDLDVVSEKHRYDIDERCYPDGRDFLFLNSLGGMDTVRVLEVEEITIKKESEVVERFVGVDNTLQDGKYYEFNVQTNREHKASTILIADDQRKWMQEFFASERVFEIKDGRFLPIRITSNSTSIKKKSTDYMAIDFTYVYRFDDIGYTKQ